MKKTDLLGNRYGRLVVIAPAENVGVKTAWLCQCDCGRQKVVSSASLISGKTKSCGCYHSEASRERMTKYPRRSRRLYKILAAMKARCYDTAEEEYPNYGGRGIVVCDEWLRNPGSFYKWAYAHGYDDNAERGACTIDRIDNNGPYAPWNCRWINQKDQQRNTSRNVYLTHNGETHCIAEWAEIIGVPYNTLQQRIKRGWNVEDALTIPKMENWRKYKR